jgi:GcrA cell cycle regulator
MFDVQIKQGSTWSEERIAELRKLWEAGLSCSMIAKEMNCGFTRNAIIGKCHRLGLKQKDSPKARVPYRRDARVFGPKPPRPARPRRETVDHRPDCEQRSKHPTPQRIYRKAEPKPWKDAMHPIGEMKLLSIVELTNTTCRFPIGDPLDERFAFCGNDCRIEDPYCFGHMRIAYQGGSSYNERQKRKPSCEAIA